MRKSRSGQLADSAPLRFTPFLPPYADPSVLRRQDPFYFCIGNKMNNFFLCSIFVRSASVSHRLALCFSHDLQPTSERSERPTTSADERHTTSGATPPSSGMTHSRFRASCLPYQCVINRAVSTAYPICTPLPPFFHHTRFPKSE